MSTIERTAEREATNVLEGLRTMLREAQHQQHELARQQQQSDADRLSGPIEPSPEFHTRWCALNDGLRRASDAVREALQRVSAQSAAVDALRRARLDAERPAALKEAGRLVARRLDLLQQAGEIDVRIGELRDMHGSAFPDRLPIDPVKLVAGSEGR